MCACIVIGSCITTFILENYCLKSHDAQVAGWIGVRTMNSLACMVCTTRVRSNLGWSITFIVDPCWVLIKWLRVLFSIHLHQLRSFPCGICNVLTDAFFPSVHFIFRIDISCIETADSWNNIDGREVFQLCMCLSYRIKYLSNPWYHNRHSLQHLYKTTPVLAESLQLTGLV